MKRRHCIKYLGWQEINLLIVAPEYHLCPPQGLLLCFIFIFFQSTLKYSWDFLFYYIAKLYSLVLCTSLTKMLLYILIGSLYIKEYAQLFFLIS